METLSKIQSRNPGKAGNDELDLEIASINQQLEIASINQQVESCLVGSGTHSLGIAPSAINAIRYDYELKTLNID